LMSLRILLRVSPRQSPRSAILFVMSSDADWPWLASVFFMFSPWNFRICFTCKTVVNSLFHWWFMTLEELERASDKLRQRSEAARSYL